MSRIRLIKPVEPPPKDRLVQWFFAHASPVIMVQCDLAKDAVAWCLPAQLDGTTSGPVHSLEAQELPDDCVRVLVRIHTTSGWLTGWCSQKTWFLAPHPGSSFEPTRCQPSSWRPLPDDEPGDAELLEAARALLKEWDAALSGQAVLTCCVAPFADLRAVIRKRTEGGK